MLTLYFLYRDIIERCNLSKDNKFPDGETEKMSSERYKCGAFDSRSEGVRKENNWKPLAKPVYHLLKDSQIKAKLKELKLPTSGSREVLAHSKKFDNHICVVTD